MRRFLMGNQILALSAQQAGAKIMFGYPITPASEIMETWAQLAQADKSLSFLQTEDEMAAGFGAIGACLAGRPAFTATSGPGNVLMQDAFSMAESLRVPLVALIMQRGGMSTSTVIYSQEEVRLTCFGGNGEGFRLVYSTSSLQELYDYTFKAFINAWKFRWPTFILADGYQAKMKGEVNISNGLKKENLLVKPLLHQGVNLRNCYNLEEEVGELILNYAQDYENDRLHFEEAENYYCEGAKIIILAHGIVAAACLPAVDRLRKKGLKIGLFRPITLRPFPQKASQKYLSRAQKLLIFESALGQLAEIFKREFYGLNIPLVEINKPAVGFTPEEIYETVSKLS
jgi:2-oxoglutarate ferredoxin oxidoreductase subunit alpha